MPVRIESTGFGVEELERFLADIEDVDRRALVARLEAASARLAGLGARVRQAAGGEAWSAHEVLAHIAVLSRFYGIVTYKIGRGEMTELDLLGNVNLRDVAGQEMARMPPEELVALALADQRRTLDYLRGATVEELRRSARLQLGGEQASEMTAAEVARLPLCSHLEQHLDQLEAALA